MSNHLRSGSCASLELAALAATMQLNREKILAHIRLVDCGIKFHFECRPFAFDKGNHG
jgi:hypothetical protein